MSENLEKRKSYESKVIDTMIGIYCRHKHSTTNELCPDCKALSEYSYKRIKHCPLGEAKTSCQHCKVHCYQSEYREKIRQVMRFAGPRMIFSHPIMAVRHLISERKK